MENDNLKVLGDLYADLKAKHAQDFQPMELELLSMMLFRKGACIPTVCKHLTANDFVNDEHKNGRGAY